MARRKQSRGKCTYCGKDYTRAGMSRHLAACPERQAAIDQADAGRGKTQPIYHIVVQGAYAPDYWLHLEIPGQSTLDQFDYYLRAIWLECCGHLSMFKIGGNYYTDPRAMDGMFDDQPLTVKAQQVLGEGFRFEYEYDFGSTTYLALHVVSERQGRPTTTSARPVALMARNDEPNYSCALCDQQAEVVCAYCQYDPDEPSLFCADHIADHEMHEEALLDLVNSPRTGECAYDGPAEPPY